MNTPDNLDEEIRDLRKQVTMLALEYGRLLGENHEYEKTCNKVREDLMKSIARVDDLNYKAIKYVKSVDYKLTRAKQFAYGIWVSNGYSHNEFANKWNTIVEKNDE